MLLCLVWTCCCKTMMGVSYHEWGGAEACIPRIEGTGVQRHQLTHLQQTSPHTPHTRHDSQPTALSIGVRHHGTRGGVRRQFWGRGSGAASPVPHLVVSALYRGVVNVVCHYLYVHVFPWTCTRPLACLGLGRGRRGFRTGDPDTALASSAARRTRRGPMSTRDPSLR